VGGALGEISGREEGERKRYQEVKRMEILNLYAPEDSIMKHT
jgi:hypothetical protein